MSEQPMSVVPVQPSNQKKVDERIARRAYVQFKKQFGHSVTFEKLHERGGFSWFEIAHLLYREIVELEEALEHVQPA